MYTKEEKRNPSVLVPHDEDDGSRFTGSVVLSAPWSHGSSLQLLPLNNVAVTAQSNIVIRPVSVSTTSHVNEIVIDLYVHAMYHLNNNFSGCNRQQWCVSRAWKKGGQIRYLYIVHCVHLQRI